LFAALDVAKHAQVLADSILVYFHFLGPQVRDRVVVLVAYHQIQNHFPRSAVNHRLAGFDYRRGTGLTE
jgi:hypothetical protein